MIEFECWKCRGVFNIKEGMVIINSGGMGVGVYCKVCYEKVRAK